MTVPEKGTLRAVSEEAGGADMSCVLSSGRIDTAPLNLPEGVMPEQAKKELID